MTDLFSQDNIDLVAGKLQELRQKLLDSSRRNPLIDIKFRPTSTSVIRVVDELPDILRHKLVQGQNMRFAALPALEDALADEQTDEFQDFLFIAKQEDEVFLTEIENIDLDSVKAEERVIKAERALKDRVRAALNFPLRQTKDDLSLVDHARNHNISPSYLLPMPSEVHSDGRHEDSDIQTLLLPDRLSRAAKSILEKGRSFERETGVNVLHAAFGLLEWQSPEERERFVSPLLLLEIRLDRRQSPQGAEFFVRGIERVFVNTNLGLKFQTEHRLALPDYHDGSVEDYFNAVQDAKPPGWHWKVRREVCFGIFPSSKIAMYHDLDPTKRPVAEVETVVRLLATTGVGDNAYADTYETDNPEVAAKVPYLVMDADASQYSALVDIAGEKNLAIEGPPGSGKSQTIVNLIAAALADGKKVLFVAEKLTALDVVRSRLDASGLGNFILPLQAGRGTTETVYESIESRLEMGNGDSRSRQAFQMRQGALEKSRTILQGYLDALGSMLGSTCLTVHQVIGHAIATAEIREKLPRKIRRLLIQNSSKMSESDLNAVVSEAASFGSRLARIANMPTLWRTSTKPITTHDIAEDHAATAGDLAEALTTYVHDIASSAVGVFLKENPFVIDMTAIGAPLAAAAHQERRVDPDLIEKLTDRDTRRAVRELCGQIVERQTLLARLNHYLRDPEGWNIESRLAAATDFAREHGQTLDADRHRARLANIEAAFAVGIETIAAAKLLPRSWTGSGLTLTEIQVGAKNIASQPSDILALRRADPMGSVPAIAVDLENNLIRLLTELSGIRQTMPSADGLDSASDMRSAAATIDNAGLFGRMGAAYKAARQIYVVTLGGYREDVRSEMARRMREYADWLDRRREYDSNSRYAECFGQNFRGLDTDMNAIGRVVTFHAICKELAASSVDLKQYLETGDLAPVFAFAEIEMEDVPPIALDDAELAQRELLHSIEREKRFISECEGHLELFRDKTKALLSEIEEILSIKTIEAELSHKIEVSSAQGILGCRFSGVTTHTETLTVECDLAEAVSTIEEPTAAIEMLRSSRIDMLAEEFKSFTTRRTQIEKQVADFAADLGLPQGYSTPVDLAARMDDLKIASHDPQSLLDRAQLKRAEDSLRNQGLGDLIDWAIEQGSEFESDQLGPIVRAIIARSMADYAYEKWGEALQGYDGQDFDRIRAEIQHKDKELITMSKRVIVNELLSNALPPVGNNIGRKSSFSEMSLIYNELHKKKRRIGIRELTKRAGRALLELKPCWMMSPLAVAQYLHDDMRFDLVVIDEASQMTPENAIGAISRAGQSVIVGDTKQLPPTSFFQKVLDDSDIDDDLREDSESILDMANVAFMPVRQLRWHYRSRHSALIQFSNQWMYKGELTIFPSAHEDHPDLGVELVEVPGVYKGRRNEIEARSVVAAAVYYMTHRPELSLGICTMNSDQKDLILEEFERERDRNRKVQAFVEKWEEENDALEEFFIKNIETIQGDERDVMMISTLYGPETVGGKVLQRFGPINSAQGHRRLNVLFTRAKRKIVTFTSMKPSDILVDDGKNLGVRMFRGWLEYCKTGHVPDTAGRQGGTESPFEDYVAAQIERLGCEVVPQVGVAGFRIDLGVRHPDWPYGYILGVECDGAAYHSSKSSRDRDRLRQEVLEGLGWRLHRIWSTDWFRNPKREIEVLKEIIDVALAQAKDNGVRHSEKLNTILHVTNPVDKFHTQIETVSLPVPESTAPLVDPARKDNSNPKSTQTTMVFDPPHRVDLFSAEGQANHEPSVALGSLVKIENITDGGKKLAFKLVAGENAPNDGRVGIHTPLGEALIDAQVGDEVEYQVGSLIKEVRVLEIK